VSGSNHSDAFLYKVNLTRGPGESAPCESEIDDVDVREVGTMVCEDVLRLDVAVNDAVTADALPGRRSNL
jgi:hypothetical protein